MKVEVLKSYSYSVLCQNDLDLGFPADRTYGERLNTAERVNDIRHPINLQLFDWRVTALNSIHQRTILLYSKNLFGHSVIHKQVWTKAEVKIP